ncbi:MAG: PLP-dependent aminotransferase family protein [Sphingobacterium sp.]
MIHVDRESTAPLYLQIANQLIRAIASGRLPAGVKLLGTRQLSTLLQVHRNTITAVYDELYAQGWVDIRPNQGTFVTLELPHLPITDQRFQYPDRVAFSYQKTALLDSPFERVLGILQFNDGAPDIRLTQIDDLSRYYSSNMKRKSNRSKMGYFNHEGSEYFKQQMVNYIGATRGLPIDTGNLLITRSIEMSLYIISEVLLSSSDCVVVGEIGYFAANMIFQKSGSRIQTVPVDEEGLNVNALEDICRKQAVRLVYVTPHHHYPTTVSMSAQRRIKLLQLAKQYGFAIVEDDYDYDFQYDKHPLLPIASNDQHGSVIYVGSFGKSLAPGFRTGFVVAPSDLMQEMRKHLGIIDRQGDVLMEQVLGEMIEEGAIHRHLKKSLKVYKERRDLMTQLLESKLGENIEFQTPSGGLAIWVQWRRPINLLGLAQRSAKRNLFIPRTLLYQNRSLQGMRIGFGHLNPREMESAIKILQELNQE